MELSEANMLKRNRESYPYRGLCVKLEQVKGLIFELGRQSTELSYEIEAEERRVGIYDPKLHTYSPLAKSLRARRDKLQQSIESLTHTLEVATLVAA